VTPRLSYSSSLGGPLVIRKLLMCTVVGLVLCAGASVPGTASATTGGTGPRPGSGPHVTWKPPGGVAFNYPVGSPAARTVLVRRVIAAIDHTPGGETIRMAAYSFDRRDVMNAFLRARHRGVHVQIVLNDNWTSPQTMHLRRVLGHNRKHRSFVIICKGSCRGGPGNLHMKVYTFSRTGAAKNVVITGSANMTDRAVSLQWNDLYTMRGERVLYDTFVHVFNQLKRDRPVSPRWVTFHDGNIGGQFYKTADGTKATTSGSSVSTRTFSESKLPGPVDDPVLQRLKRVRCTAVPGAGVNGHTVIRITMYGWNGARGKWLANQVADLKRRGCDVKVILGVPGGGIVKILHAAKIPLKSSDYNYLNEGTIDDPVWVVNFYSHLKALAINGTLAGHPVHSVWTGSENWSSMSFRNDEIILRIDSARTYRTYAAWFDFMWNHGTHKFGIKPAGKPRPAKLP
jgi:hypothetical protein